MLENEPSSQEDPNLHDDQRPRLRRLSERLPAILFVLTLTIGLILVLTLSIPSGPAPLRVGDVAKQNIRAPDRVSYVSQIKTKQAKDAAAANIPDVYDYDPGVAQQQRAQAQILFNGIANIRADSTLTAELKQDRIQRLADGIVTPATSKMLLAVNDLSWPQVVTESTRVLDEVMRDRVRQSDLAATKTKLPSRFSQSLASDQLAAAVAIVSDLLKPNEVFNPTETSRRKKDAQDQIDPVRDAVEKGEIVVREGNVVSALDLEKLEALGLQQTRTDWSDVFSAAILVVIIVAFFNGYVSYFHPAALVGGHRALLLILGILVISLAARLASSERAVEGVTWVYIVPFAAVPMLVGMLIDHQLAVVVAFIIGILAGFTGGQTLDIAVMAMLGGGIGALMTRRIERLTTFFWAGAMVALTNLGVVVAFFLAGTVHDTTALAATALMALTSGGLAAAITAVSFAPLGNLVGTATVLHLLEMAHPSQPLFRRLLLDASGTYHHSVVISTLAERAAESIGADSLLTRVGAYYHDIGKVVRPYLYIENQMNGINIHDTLDPKTSADAIMSHVPEGLALARKYHLPARVQDMIPQHHGTKLVSFFYSKAKSQGLDPKETDYRYQGPKPQTKEAAILMMADGVEAAVRASRDHSQETTERLVREIVTSHMADGQLTECDLTLKDIDKIIQAFCGVLQGVYHPRIAYPPPAGVEQPTQDNAAAVPMAPAPPVTIQVPVTPARLRRRTR